MIQPKPGEVYWVDLGMKAKFRPVFVVSREDPDSERALHPRPRVINLRNWRQFRKRRISDTEL